MEANQMWKMDFTRDRLASGTKFRTLNLTDGYTREALSIGVDTSWPGLRVGEVLEISSVAWWASGPTRMTWRCTLSIPASPCKNAFILRSWDMFLKRI